MQNLISLEKVSVIKNGKYILRHIDWSMNENENWAIIGENGSGKSFLLRLLSANLHSSKGTVKVFGKQFGQVNLWDLKKNIGLVSDLLQTQYHNRTRVIDVVYSGYFSSIGLYENIDSRMKKSAYKILKFLGIYHLKDRIFGELSHGEQRRVLIARSLVFNPKLLVLDEPCTGLDIPAREEFLKTIEKLVKKGHNVIFVTHHIEEVMPFINRILFMKNGKIFGKGTKKEMMKEEKLNKVLGHKFKLIYKNGRYWPKYH
jgi:iron complex transport system ATP-binding protein